MSRAADYRSATSRTVILHAEDTSGNDLTTLAYNTAGLVVEYRKQGQNSWTAITLVAGTLGTYTSSGFVHDSQGDYELGLPTAAMSSGEWVAIRWRGAASLKTGRMLIPLHSLNYQHGSTGLIADARAVAGYTAIASAAVNFDLLNGLARAIAGLTPQLPGTGATPEWWNLEKAATRIRYGYANTVWIGDSQSSAHATPRVAYGILRTWDVRYIQLHLPANASVSDEGWSSFFNGGTGFTATNDVLPGGTANGVTNNTALLMSSVTAAANVGSFTPFHDAYLGSLDQYNNSGTPPRQFSNGDWTVNQRLKCAVLYAKHPTAGTNLSNPTLASQRGAETVGYSAYDLTTAAAGHSLIAFDFSTPSQTAYTYTRSYWQTGTEDESGKVFSHTGHLVYIEQAQNGYSHAAIAQGGWSTTDHLSPLNSGDDAEFYSSDGKYTQAQLITTLGLLRNPNTFIILIGTNIGADEDGSTIAPYKANVRKIIDRYRDAATAAGIDDPLFVLIAPWHTGGTDSSDVRNYRDAQAQALYELAQETPTDTAFVNLHAIILRRLGSYSIWQGTYLADGTHPSATGAVAFMSYVWDAICHAAAVAGLSTIAALQGRKLDLDATATPAAATTGALLDRLANKNASKTYSQATDSLEAIRDRGDAAWITGATTGSGARTVTITVNDGTTAIAGALVRCTLNTDSHIAATNGSGQVTFNLDDGSWTIAITRSGYTFAGATLTVDGNEAQTYSMTAIVITPAADPAQTTGYLTTRNGQGTATGSVVVTFKLVRGPGTAGHAYDRTAFTATSNGSGLLTVTLLREAEYIGRRADGTEVAFSTPDASTYELPEILGLTLS